nr:DUF551 domain-containing protein [Klebsiella michiganensis]
MTSKLTREERVQALYDLKVGQVLSQADIENVKMLARMALAAMDSEAKESISFDEWSRKCALQITLCYPDFREKAQYIWDSARETQQPAPVVPDRSIFEQWWESQNGAPLDGWDSLRTTDGYCDDGIDGQFEAWSAAMLAAAPQSPGSEPATVPGKWIPVSERMPEDRISVILWDAEIGEVTSGHYSHKTQTFYHCGDAIENEITHWMPPPCAPQEVK